MNIVPSVTATVSQSMHVSYSCCHPVFPVFPLIHSTQHALDLSAACKFFFMFRSCILLFLCCNATESFVSSELTPPIRYVKQIEQFEALWLRPEREDAADIEHVLTDTNYIFPSSQKEHWHYGQLFPIMLCPYAVFSDSLSLKLSSETPSTFDALKSQSDYSSCGCLSTINSTHRLFTDWLMTAGSGLYRRKLIQIKFQHSCHNVKFLFYLFFLAGNQIF